jgi:uncharacterized membrane protein
MDSTLKLLIIIISIGILNTIYLAYHTFTHKLVACIFFPKEWCEKVQKSNYSKTFGIPNSYLGLLMLTLILLFTLLYSNGTLSFVPAFIVIAAGFLFSTYFLYIQAFVLKAFCTWCVLSFLVFTALFITGSTLIFS